MSNKIFKANKIDNVNEILMNRFHVLDNQDVEVSAVNYAAYIATYNHINSCITEAKKLGGNTCVVMNYKPKHTSYNVNAGLTEVNGTWCFDYITV